MSLGEEKLQQIARGVADKDETVHEILDRLWLDEDKLQAGNEDEVCEAVLLALLRGHSANQVKPLTGITPLMRASEEGQQKLCQLLLSLGADADRSSVGGSTALALALAEPCSRCMVVGRPACHCAHRAVSELLLPHTEKGLPEVLAAAVRLALQDIDYLPLMQALITKKHLPVDLAFEGPDGRLGTPISIALERQVCPVEGTLANRAAVVSTLLDLGADPCRPGPYVAWWGSSAKAGGADLVTFARANSCDAVTVEVLRRAVAIKTALAQS